MKVLRVLLALLKSYLISIGLFVHLLALGAIAYYGIDSGAARAGQLLGRVANHLSAHRLEVLPAVGRGAGDGRRGVPPDAFAYRTHEVALENWIGAGRVLRVGPDAAYKQPSEAARAAHGGETILIAPGRYAADTAVWTADDLYIKGDGGLVQLDARGASLAEGKAIWVTRGDHIRIENVEFMNASVPDQNGAGIRAEGNHLHVVGCYFHDNESGLMSRNNPDAEIHIEYSEFARNGHPSGQAHQIYAGTIAQLIVEASYIHHGQYGSDVKSRAAESRILYSRILDGADGRGNYSIDLSEGGRAVILGNVIQQGPNGENYTIIAFAPEKAFGPTQALYVVHNTLVNDRDDGVFLWNHTDAAAWVYDNILAGRGQILRGPAILAGNVIAPGRRRPWPLGATGLTAAAEALNRFTDDVGFKDRAGFDYALRAGSAAIGAGVEVPPAAGESLLPRFQPERPLTIAPRRPEGRDAGALEFRK